VTDEADDGEQLLPETTPMGRDNEQDSSYGETGSSHDHSESVPPGRTKSRYLRRHQPDTGDEDQQEPNLRELDPGPVCDRNDHLSALPTRSSRPKFISSQVHLVPTL
jgi:hypothetical protein